MDFDFTPDQELFRRSVREFMMREAPREKIRKWDEEGHFPAEVLDKMAEIGWFGLPFPEEYGGANLDAISFAILSEEIARQEDSIAGVWGATIFLSMALMCHGTQEQVNYYIPRVVNGDQRFSMSFTEPDAGSDLGSLRTTAVADGEFFVISGQKMFASFASRPKNTIFLGARTEPDLPKHKGLSVFLLDPKAPGVEIRPVPTLGHRIEGTNAIYLDNARVPRANLVGSLNGGWKVLLSGVELERVFVAAMVVGVAQAATDDAIQYAKERVQFGQPIGKFQAIAHMLADMQTEVDAARLLAYRVAFLVSKGRSVIKEASMAKLYGSETAVRVTNQGMQILGGFGYTMESDMQRYLRNARIMTLAGGSSQIQRDIIAKQLGL